MIKLPSDAQAAALLKTYHVPSNIIAHSLKVNSVAQYLGEFFDVDADLLDKASLLHDLFRVVDIRDWKHGHFDSAPSTEAIHAWSQVKQRFPGSHEEVAYAFFKEKYPELALTIREHKFKHVFDLSTQEQKLLTYADKRCKHDTIVSLTERFRDGRIRNKDLMLRQNFDEALLERTEAAYFDLEKELFAVVGKDPANLERDVATFMESNKYHDWRPLIA